MVQHYNIKSTANALSNVTFTFHSMSYDVATSRLKLQDWDRDLNLLYAVVIRLPFEMVPVFVTLVCVHLSISHFILTTADGGILFLCYSSQRCL